MNLLTPFRVFIILTMIISGTTMAQSVGYIENKGQWDEEIIAYYRLANGAAWFMNDRVRIPLVDETLMLDAAERAHDHREEAVLLDGHSYEMRFGSGSNGPVNFYGRHPDYVNYYLGNKPERWAGRVGVYDKLSYYEVADGVDLHWTMEKGNMKYTYYVSGRANPGELYIEYNAVRNLELKDGRLVITLPGLSVEEQQPYAFQLINGAEIEVPCAFRIRGNRVYYDLGDYDPEYMLYIDPVVVASTNVGATVSTYGHSATFDQFGNIYGGGRPFGTGYPTDTGSFQVDFAGGGVDIGLSKLNEDGSALLWSTYIGGSGAEYVHSIVVNGFNDVIIYGQTNSPDYPVSANAFDTSYNGSIDICITALSDSGDVLVGSTYFGGIGLDGNNSIPGISYGSFKGEVECDVYSNIYIASTSNSDTLPFHNSAYQPVLQGGQDGIALKFNYNLSELIHGTYLGDSLNDGVFNIKPANDGSVYVVGVSQSPNFPTSVGAEDETWNHGQSDGFITRINEDFTDILQSTFIRADSGDADKGLFLQIDRDGEVYVLGTTTTGGISADTGKYIGPGTNQGSYIRKYTKTLDSIYWTATFASVAHSAFLVDNCKNIYAAGNGASSNGNFELTANAVQSTSAGFYVIVLNSEADSLIHGTYYGNTGSHVDGGTSRFDKRGAVYQATCSSGFFPLNSNAWSGNQNGGTYDLTLFKIDFEVQAAVANAQIAPNSVGCVPHEVDFTNYGSVGLTHFWDFDDGNTSTSQTPSHTFTEPGVYEVKYVIFDTIGCILSDTATLIITVLDSASVTVTSDSALCSEVVELSVNSPYSSYLWSTGETAEYITVASSGTYWVNVVNICGTFIDSIEVEIIPPYVFELPADTAVCQKDFSISGPADAAFYSWSSGDTTQSINISTTGPYVLVAGNAYCSDTDTVNVSVAYANFSSSDTVVCAEQLILTAVNGSGGFLWNTGDTTESITVTSEGQYWVRLDNGFCTVTDTIWVDFSPSLVDLGSDTVICEKTVFSAYAQGLKSYLWSTGDTSFAVEIDTSMTLWVVAGNQWCSDTDSIDVVRQALNFSDADELVCDADSHVLVAPLPGASYLWSTGDTTQSIVVYGSDTYHITISTKYCASQDSLNLRFGRSPNFSIGLDPVLCRGQEVSLSVDSLWSDVRWSTGDTGRTIIMLDSGLVYASMSIEGCEGRDSAYVRYRPMDPDSLFIMPNVMTPNGDGLNDALGLKVVDKSIMLDYEFTVYNRWGVRLFESNLINHLWDGNMPSGDNAEEGTYFYIVRATTVCTDLPEIEVKDNVTLIR